MDNRLFGMDRYGQMQCAFHDIFMHVIIWVNMFVILMRGGGSVYSVGLVHKWLLLCFGCVL